MTTFISLRPLNEHCVWFCMKVVVRLGKTNDAGPQKENLIACLTEFVSALVADSSKLKAMEMAEGKTGSKWGTARL